MYILYNLFTLICRFISASYKPAEAFLILSHRNDTRWLFIHCSCASVDCLSLSSCCVVCEEKSCLSFITGICVHLLWGFKL